METKKMSTFKWKLICFCQVAIFPMMIIFIFVLVGGSLEAGLHKNVPVGIGTAVYVILVLIIGHFAEIKEQIDRKKLEEKEKRDF